MDLGARALSATMGLNDGIFYTSVEASVECFPRIKYFQSKLKDLFNRFDKVYGPISESLKPENYNLMHVRDAVSILTIPKQMLFLFGSGHSRILKADLVMESRLIRVETHLLSEIPALDDLEKKYKPYGAICTVRMIEIPKEKEIILNLKLCFGIENIMFFVDAENDSEKDLVLNNLGILCEFPKEKLNVIFQREIDLSTAISNHLEQKYINAFHLLREYLSEVTQKTRYPCGGITGHEHDSAKELLARAIVGYLRTPLTLLDLFLTVEPASFAEIIEMDKVIEIAIIRVTKTLLIREIVSKYELKGERVTKYLEEIKYDGECMKRLEEKEVVKRVLHKSELTKFDLIAQLKLIAEKHRKTNSVTDLLSANRLFERLYKTFGETRHRASKTRLKTKFDEFSKSVADDASNVLQNYFTDIFSVIKGIRVKIDRLTHLRQELLRIMEKTIEGKKYIEIKPELQKWRDNIGRIKEVKAVAHMFGKLCVFVKKAETFERENEVKKSIMKCLVGYPGEIVIETSSDSLYAGADGIEPTRTIAMGDAFFSADGRRGTIGLFMNKTDSNDLHFVTSSHIVIKPGDVTTIGPTPKPLGVRAYFVPTDENLVDISIIKIYPNMRYRCNPFFQDENGIRKCQILGIDKIKHIDEGEHVYKRGPSGEVTRGCIVSTDFHQIGLNSHNFVVGVPVGSDEGPFAQPGDSGSVVYTETENYEIRYLSILMGELNFIDSDVSSRLRELTEGFTTLILTSCLSEGLEQIHKMFDCKFSLPEPQQTHQEMGD